MEEDQLLSQLMQLEQEMHLTSTRKNRERMESLLDPDFKEIGRSGLTYSRLEILNEFHDEKKLPTILVSDEAVTILHEELVLLTYKSRHDSADNPRPTLRSSLWRKRGSQWQICFHQGTAAAE